MLLTALIATIVGLALPIWLRARGAPQSAARSVARPAAPFAAGAGAGAGAGAATATAPAPRDTRLAVAALLAGDYPTALARYRELATSSDDGQAYAEIVRILGRRLAERCGAECEEAAP